MNYSMLGSVSISAVATPKYPGPGAQYPTKVVRQPMPVPPPEYTETYTGTVQDLENEIKWVIDTSTAEDMKHFAWMLRRKAPNVRTPKMAIAMLQGAERLEAAANAKAQENPNRTAAQPQAQAVSVSAPEKKSNLLPLAIAGTVAVMAFS